MHVDLALTGRQPQHVCSGVFVAVYYAILSAIFVSRCNVMAVTCV